MRKITLEQLEEKYQLGPENRFDTKYNMFSRAGWDPTVKDRLEDWGFLGDVKKRPGFTLQDQALRWGARKGTMLARFKSKVNGGSAGGGPGGPGPAPGMGGAGPAVASGPEMETVGRVSMETMSRVMPMVYTPPEGVKVDTSDPAIVTRDVKKVARYFGADMVGICKLDRRLLYLDEDIPEEFQWVIVMAFEEDYELIKYYPSYIADAATSKGYSDMAVTNAYLSAFIQNLGFQAIDSQNDTALSVPMAIQAGLGDHGRLGFLITPRYGPRVRLSKIITDLPLVPDSPIDFGVTEFCKVCKKCAHLCPSQSIPYDDRNTRANNSSNHDGELKWRINAETCRMYWGQVNKPCTTCMACCPYNKPNTWPHRTTLWFTDHMRWGDAFYVKMDELFGYGKPMTASKLARFWEEWQPGR